MLAERNLIKTPAFDIQLPMSIYTKTKAATRLLDFKSTRKTHALTYSVNHPAIMSTNADPRKATNERFSKERHMNPPTQNVHVTIIITQNVV